jgi:signal transduction histidine kinase
MTGGGEPGRRGGLRSWAQDARVRSAACAAQAGRPAESAAAVAEQADRMIERVAARNPAYAPRLQGIIVTAVSQRAAIAESKRSWAPGRPGSPLPGARNEPEAGARTELDGPVRDLAVIQERDRTGGGLQDRVIQQVFTAGLTLQDAAELSTEPEVRWRIEAAAGGLDEVIRISRDALFSAARRPGREPGSGQMA